MRQQELDPALLSLAPAARTLPRHCSLAVPRRGHVLTTVSEDYGRPVRAAVAVLAKELQYQDCAKTHQSCMYRRIPEPRAWIVRPHAELLAWTLVSAWLTGFATGKIQGGGGLEDAADWFFDGALMRNPATLISRHALTLADEALTACRDPAGYLELLPYVLDPHGPGSRLSIRRDAGTRAARDRKRAEGVYYTPADVAAYMVRECLNELGENRSPPIIFDPACGTGVFLRAALDAQKATSPDQPKQSLAETTIYGTDVDPWALDAAAFVLLADCLVDSRDSIVSPLPRWHRLRLNLACVDALRLDPRHPKGQTAPVSVSCVVDALRSGRLPASGETTNFDQRVPLSQLFAWSPENKLVVVGNPPYSTVGDRPDFTVLKKLFASLGGKAGPTAEIYPLFIEQMVRLAPSGAAAGTLVLPLSLASNIGYQFTTARSLIEKTPGTWRFAFFDREPHALFGEDVKTRNTILFWHRNNAECKTRIESSPLRKWRGHRRAAMFASIRFTPLTAPLRPGIPKIDGALQARAFETLAKRWDRFDHACPNIRRVPLALILEDRQPAVFAGATAYNFLNVFMKPTPDVLPPASPLSQHPLHVMRFPTNEDAAAVFALLSSHLIYWWWHVTRDGFHVTRHFLAGLPFGLPALSRAPLTALAVCGERLWSLIRSQPIISVNRGRTSLAFSPTDFNDERREIDQILATLTGLEPAFVNELQHYTENNIHAEPNPMLNTYARIHR